MQDAMTFKLVSQLSAMSGETSPLLEAGCKRQDSDFSEKSFTEEQIAAAEVVSSYDQILSHIGGLGKWQMFSVAVLWPPSIAAGIIVLLTSFSALEPSAYRCALKVVGH